MGRGFLLFIISLGATFGTTGCGNDIGERPSPPVENDPAFTIEGVQPYALIGDELTPGTDRLQLEVIPPSGVSSIALWLNEQSGVALTVDGDRFTVELDISDLGAGEHELLLAADGASIAFARHTFLRTHPLYVIVSTDWDDADTSDFQLSLQDELHQRFEELKITHFVGPYTFTDPELAPQRVELLKQWLVAQETNFDDEIGLHIHPYCHFVETTDVNCRTQPSLVYDAGDDTGYSVNLSAYSRDEFATLLRRADELFVDNGFAKPTSFRAGGWSADINTLHALVDTGYVVDTSANNWMRMEEWRNQANGVLYDWNQANWMSITDTSQPYYPAQDDILNWGTPYLPILEVPDNGILVDYVTGQEMIEIFHANWVADTALDRPTQLSIGYHPNNYNQVYQQRMIEALDHISEYQAVDGQGPVVFQTLTNMTRVWPLPDTE